MIFFPDNDDVVRSFLFFFYVVVHFTIVLTVLRSTEFVIDFLNGTVFIS